MQKILFLKGLPASGKSTFAKFLCQSDPLFKRINKDDIRERLGNREWSLEFEKEVLAIQREEGIKYIEAGFSLIVDDTNFAKKHEIWWKNIAEKYFLEFEEKFFDVDVEECIRRDKEREKSVGEAVIRKMYKQHLKPTNIIVDDRLILNQDEELPSCIICDLDGTISLINGRTPYDDKKVINDKVNTPVKIMLERYNQMGVEIIYVTGRMKSAKENTIKWLLDNDCWFGHTQKIYFRENGDFRPDDITKMEIYEKKIKDKYFVEFVLEDRDSVVKLWRDIGLLCLQVYYGDF